MKELDYSSLALDTLLVHSNKPNSASNNSGKPTVDPISTSTTYLHSILRCWIRHLTVFLPLGNLRMSMPDKVIQTLKL